MQNGSLLGAILASGVMAVSPAPAAAGPASIASWFDKVPAPPKTLTEALAKAHVNEKGRLRCEALGVEAFKGSLEAYMEPIRSAHSAAKQELAHQRGEPRTQAEMQAYVAKATADSAKMMAAQQPYMEIATKYQQEAMALMQDAKMPMDQKGKAMEKLQAKYQPLMEAAQAKMEAASPEKDEPKVDLDKGELPEVLQVRKQLDALRLTSAEPVNRLTDTHRNGHDALNETLKTKGAACYDPHVAAAGADLQSEQAAWAQLLAELRRQAAETDRLMGPVQYGAKAKTPKSRANLIDRHLDTLRKARDLAGLSEDICENAVVWSKSRDYASKGGDVCNQPSYVMLCGAESIGRDYTTIARNCRAKKDR